MIIGSGVVLYGVHKKKQYGYITPSIISTWIIIPLSIIIWPLTIVHILSFVKREEQIISEVIKDNPKYTRDMLLSGAKIWHDLRGGKKVPPPRGIESTADDKTPHKKG
jgi:hypothetical protein